MTEQEAVAGPSWVQEVENGDVEMIENKDEQEMETEDETTLAKRVVRQLECYFGDVNINRDEFLRDQMKLDNGWIPLTTLIKCVRLSYLTQDIAFIANAVKNENSILIEVSEDNQKIRRKPNNPVPEVNPALDRKMPEHTAINMKSPPKSSLEDVLGFLKALAATDILYANRGRVTDPFNRSVMVTLTNTESPDKCIALTKITHGGPELFFCPPDSVFKTREQANEDGVTDAELKQLNLPTGSILHFTKCAAGDIKRKRIAAAMATLGGDVAYIEYLQGQTEGWVRLKGQDAAKAVYNKLPNGVLSISGTRATFRVLEGAEEAEYLKMAGTAIVRRQKINARRQSKSSQRDDASTSDPKKKATSAINSDEKSFIIYNTPDGEKKIHFAMCY